MIEVKKIEKFFPLKETFVQTILASLRKKKKYVNAVNGVSFTMSGGEIMGLAGESAGIQSLIDAAHTAESVRKAGHLHCQGPMLLVGILERGSGRDPPTASAAGLPPRSGPLSPPRP